MSKTDIQGKVAFINHEKQYIMIEYELNNKKKTVKGIIDPKRMIFSKGSKVKKSNHHFLMGDVVSFTLRLDDRGDKMMAADISFLYNNALDVLINKAMLDNKFLGYLKEADGQYFVKEIDSYLFFPISFSPWQIIPPEADLNEAVTFTLENLEKKDKIRASLLNNEYIPEFQTAVKLFKSKTAVDAVITNITEFGIYLDVVGDKIKAKIGLDKNKQAAAKAESLVVGEKLQVMITHIGKSRIAVEMVD